MRAGALLDNGQHYRPMKREQGSTDAAVCDGGIPEKQRRQFDVARDIRGLCKEPQ